MDNWEIYYRTHKGKGSNTKTGIPPLTFVSNGENLVDYRIYGASGGVGNRTRNLFNKDKLLVNGKPVKGYAEVYSNIITGLEASTQYTLSSNVPLYQDANHLYLVVDNDGNYDIIYNEHPATQKSNQNGELIFWYATRVYYNDLKNGKYWIMLNKDSTAATYEPYGYKIPIICGDTTTNIYLDKPLSEGESISMSDTGISIPTINGTNVLTVDTEVQPSKMYIKYGGSSNVNQSLMKYLEYKYKFAKE